MAAAVRPYVLCFDTHQKKGPSLQLQNPGPQAWPRTAAAASTAAPSDDASRTCRSVTCAATLGPSSASSASLMYLHRTRECLLTYAACFGPSSSWGPSCQPGACADDGVCAIGAQHSPLRQAVGHSEVCPTAGYLNARVAPAHANPPLEPKPAPAAQQQARTRPARQQVRAAHPRKAA